MSDIVERLRAWGTGYSVHKEAAHEIEKLRAERDGLQVALKNIAAKAADEIEKLRAERDMLRAALDKAADALHDAGCYDAWAVARAALGEKE